MNKHLSLVFSILLGGLILFSCEETSIIGSDLLEDDELNLNFTDTVGISARFDSSPPLVSSQSTTNTYITGVLDDPFLGKTTSEVYFEPSYNVSVNTDNTTYDSVVVSISYDTSGFYGDWQNSTFDIRVYELTSDLSADTIFTNEVIPFNPDPIGEMLGVSINIQDSIEIFDAVLDSLVKRPSQLRVKLNDDFGQELYGRIGDFDDVDDVIAEYPGFKIVATPTNGSSATIGLNMGTTANNADINGINIYFTTTTEDPRQYEYSFGFDRYVQIDHEYDGYPINDLFNINMVEDFLYVQGMVGVRTIIDLKGVDQFTGSLINKAELELTIADEARFELDIYPPIDRYAMGYINDDGDLIGIADIGFIGGDPFVFDGFLEDEMLDDGREIQRVKFNITNHIIQLLDNPDWSREIVITPFSSVQTPNRSIFYGTDHPEFRARLNLAVTSPE